MPPKKRARGNAQAAASKNNDNMDVDSPPKESTIPADKFDPAGYNYNDLWNDDQVASLFKGVIRWKPAGMHKHFRMIAISEHLRNHGFDPDIYQHLRVPHIWQKLRTYYNLEIIDERENFDEDEPEDRYAGFSLPLDDFYDKMMARAVSETPTTPPQLDLDNPTARKVGKRKRAASRSKDKAETTEEEEQDDEEEEEKEGGEEAEEEAEQEEEDEEEQENPEESGSGQDEEEGGEESEEDTAAPIQKGKGQPKGKEPKAARGGRSSTRSSRRK